MLNLILRAAALARIAHEGQKRKYSGRPYVEHPGRVAMQAALHSMDEEHVAAAWLHDVLEDTEVSPTFVKLICGEEVLKIVEGLTNPSKGSPLSRADRKALDRAKLSCQPTNTKVLKALDRADNCRDMKGVEADFIKLYAGESRQLAVALKGPAFESSLLKHVLFDLEDAVIEMEAFKP
jgi:(p)ppGpp synthase/HD superfamily hydrolase